MAYVDTGSGDPVIFLHGNPTSSFLWRNIMGPLSGRARCIAPHLIGMGDSDKLTASGPGSYSFFEHRSFLDGFVNELRLDRKVVLVVHDGGSALGFDWAYRHPDRVRAVAYMEAIVGPMRWDDYAPPHQRFHVRVLGPRGVVGVWEWLLGATEPSSKARRKVVLLPSPMKM
jgi:haloalkane dehalogenase